MTNFVAIASELKSGGAAKVVTNEAEIAAAAQEILSDGAKREAMTAAALAWHRANQGAVARTLEIVRAELAKGWIKRREMERGVPTR